MSKNAPIPRMSLIQDEEAVVIKRPPVKADFTPEFVFWAASHFISQEVIGELFGCSQSAISQRLSREPYKSAYASGRAAAKMNLHAAQYRNAVVKDQAVPQIWLGKQYLDQRDSVHQVEQTTNVEIRYVAEWGGGGELPAPADDVIEGELEEGSEDE